MPKKDLASTPPPDMPTFGQIEDEKELGLDYEPVPFQLVAYDMVPDPATGDRAAHTFVFHAIPDMRAERLIPATAKGKKGEVDVQSLGRILLGMIVPEERDDFLDTLEDPNLAYSGDMFMNCFEWLMETATGGHPTEPSSVSSPGRKKAGQTSKVVHSGRTTAALETSG